MSFAHPGWLALLLVVAALAVVYWRLQRRRKRDTMRFTNLEMLERIAPRPSRFRHVPTALLLVASVALEFARRKIFHPTDTVEEWLGLGYLTGKHTLPWLLAGMLAGCGFIVDYLQKHPEYRDLMA